jgi:hypothetical protein
VNEKKGLLKRLVADLKLDISNLEATVERVSIEAIEMAGMVQSSFAEFNSLMSSAQPPRLAHETPEIGFLLCRASRK